MKKIVILIRHGEKIDDLKDLLKSLFPECEICTAPAMEKDDKSPVHSTPPRVKKGDGRNKG